MYGQEFAVHSGENKGAPLRDRMIKACLFYKKLLLPSKVPCHSALSPAMNRDSCWCTSSSAADVVGVLDLSCSNTGVVVYLIVILIYISLMAHGVEHLFIHFLAICVSLVRSLLKSLAHFSVRLLAFLLLHFKSSLCSLDHSSLSDMCLQLFSPGM